MILNLSRLGSFLLCVNFNLFSVICILGPVLFQHLHLNHSFSAVAVSCWSDIKGEPVLSSVWEQLPACHLADLDR